MRLDINTKYGLEFVLYIIKKLQEYIIGNINDKKLVFIEEYINQNYKSMYRKHISARDVLVSGAMNLTYQIYANKFTVEIDSKQILYGTNAKLYDICKLINFGVLGIGSYPILTDSFDYFKDNLDYMYEYYIREKEALDG